MASAVDAAKKLAMLMKLDSSKIDHYRQFPMQENTYDCGIYALMACEILIKNGGVKGAKPQFKIQITATNATKTRIAILNVLQKLIEERKNTE